MEKSAPPIKKTKTCYYCAPSGGNGFLCAFSTRAFNYDLRAVSGRKKIKEVLCARKNFFTRFGQTIENAVFLEQVHKADITLVGGKARGRGAFVHEDAIAGCDAALTDTPAVALCMLSADCLPLVFFEPQKRVVGIAHAGWRGVRKGVVENTVYGIVRHFGIRPAHVFVYIGPGIRACCYKVDRRFIKWFPDDTVVQGKEVYCDLAGAVKRRLLATGILSKNITDTLLCTKCRRETFFSYRGGDGQKRMLTMAVLKK